MSLNLKDEETVAIRRWVRRQQPQDEYMWLPPFRKNHENPHRLLEEQRNGIPGACRRFSYILLGALLSAGFDARIASLDELAHSGRVHHARIAAAHADLATARLERHVLGELIESASILVSEIAAAQRAGTPRDIGEREIVAMAERANAALRMIGDPKCWEARHV